MRFSFSWSRKLAYPVGVLTTVMFCGIADSQQKVLPGPRVFDQYGQICWEYERARLDNFAVQLENEPGYIGNIVVYDGRRACRGEAIARAVRAKRYLVSYRGLSANRVLWRFGGYREVFTVELMNVPPGYPEWSAVPSVSPKDVVFVANCDHRVRPAHCSR